MNNNHKNSKLVEGYFRPRRASDCYSKGNLTGPEVSRLRGNKEQRQASVRITNSTQSNESVRQEQWW